MEQALYSEMGDFEEHHWWFAGKRRVITAMLRGFMPAKTDVALDIGCGTGKNAELLFSFAKSVDGIDASKEAIAIAKRKQPRLRIKHAEFPNDDTTSRYKLVTLFDVLEHIKDDTHGIKRISELLTPGGTAVITVPALQSLWSEHDELLHHHRRYSKRELKALIEKEPSLKIERMSYFNSFLLPVVYPFRVARRSFALRKGQSDFFKVPGIVNRTLEGVLGTESLLMKWVDLPLGVSLICVLRKV